MRAHVFRNIERRQEFLGLEFVDALAVAIVLWLVMTFHPGHFFVNGALVALCLGAIKLAKRGQPKGYTTSVFRYTARALLRRSVLSAAAPDREGRAHPFER